MGQFSVKNWEATGSLLSGNQQKEVSDLKKTATGQRNRIDRLFAEDVRWSMADLQDYYIDHPLVGVPARKLIWDLQQPDGSHRPAIFQNGAWQDVEGRKLRTGKKTTDTAGNVC